MNSDYRTIAVEVFRHNQSGHAHPCAVRPLPGQIFEPSMLVECSKSIKGYSNDGKTFLMQIKLKEPRDAGDMPHLYSSYHWKLTEVSREDAEKFVKNNNS